MVLNYIGRHNDEGIRIYYNGREVASDTRLAIKSRSAGDGRIVVGRHYTDRNQDYASVQVDELIFFNQALTQQQIDALAAAP